MFWEWVCVDTVILFALYGSKGQCFCKTAILLPAAQECDSLTHCLQNVSSITGKEGLYCWQFLSRLPEEATVPVGLFFVRCFDQKQVYNFYLF